MFNEVTFYLDTPLIVRLLALEGTRKRDAVLELIRLLADLGGSIAMFSHSREELERVFAARLTGSKVQIGAAARSF